ncbi:MAG TPA: LON peptidase substrate-binding domain-containing protein [Gammaproteobacteria bacterium]|nr:LON peptidase substrate-binding domain-containing protein [Gammaproteobacteria bacterium]
MSEPHELPLFPLGTVLLPGGPLALRVFEPRYLDMVARCLRGENRFGVVAIREGAEVGAATPYEVGTSAEIVDWQREQNGLLMIVAHGRDGFRALQTRRQDDGLYVGSVEWLEPLPPAELPSVHAPLAALLRRLVEELPLYRALHPKFDDGVWVGNRLIELLPLALPRKQALLELRDAAERLEQLAAALALLK